MDGYSWLTNSGNWHNCSMAEEPDFSTTVVGVVLIVIGLVAGSETLKKREPERSKKDAEKE